MEGAPSEPPPLSKEEEEKALLEWLEMLKVVDPPKYQAIMEELTAAAPGRSACTSSLCACSAHCAA